MEESYLIRLVRIGDTDSLLNNLSRTGEGSWIDVESSSLLQTTYGGSQIHSSAGWLFVFNCDHWLLIQFVLQGICHRDIKPENLFLTKSGECFSGKKLLGTRANVKRNIIVAWKRNTIFAFSDVLKIGDFGLATLFFYDNKERILTMPCGTRPYASPELMNKSYRSVYSNCVMRLKFWIYFRIFLYFYFILFYDCRAQPTDIWSCGIVLVAMLSGELPWQAPDR